MSKTSYTKENFFQSFSNEFIYIKNESINDIFDKIITYPNIDSFLKKEAFICSSLNVDYKFKDNTLIDASFNFTIYTKAFHGYHFNFSFLNLNLIGKFQFDITESTSMFGLNTFFELLDKDSNYKITCDLSSKINEFKSLIKDNLFLSNTILKLLNQVFEAITLSKEIAPYFDGKFSLRKNESLINFYDDIKHYAILSEKTKLEKQIQNTYNQERQKKSKL